MFLELQQSLLTRIKTAQEAGNPVTHAELGRDVHGSTFGDLWAGGSISIKGQEGQLVCMVNPNSEYVITDWGRRLLSEL